VTAASLLDPRSVSILIAGSISQRAFTVQCQQVLEERSPFQFLVNSVACYAVNNSQSQHSFYYYSLLTDTATQPVSSTVSLLSPGIVAFQCYSSAAVYGVSQQEVDSDPYLRMTSTEKYNITRPVNGGW
jgi:hypothetical protein